MPERLVTFHNVRARVMVVAEGCWHPGWVSYLGQYEARLTMRDNPVIANGSRMLVECMGDGTLVRFLGDVAGQEGALVAIRVVGTLSFDRSQETVRLHVDGISGRLTCDGLTKLLQLVDISPESMGAVLSEELPVGAELPLELDTKFGEVSCVVRVQNCIPDSSLMPSFRAGLRIVQCSRLDAARWSKLFEHAACTA